MPESKKVLFHSLLIHPLHYATKNTLNSGLCCKGYFQNSYVKIKADPNP